MRRVRLFLKGNLDLYDSLHSCRINNTLCWNGINEVEIVKSAKIRMQIKHETWTRSDALLHSTGIVPQSLAEHRLKIGSFDFASQFSRNLFLFDADAYILSIQPDISVNLVRHKTEGYLFHPAFSYLWETKDIQWFRENFEPMKDLTPAESINNLSLIIDEIRKRSNAPILIYNASPIIPGEQVYCYTGLSDSLSVRIQKFNLGLIELSSLSGISIVDVNRILATHGVEYLKLDPWHLNGVALELIAKEVARILLELLPR